MVQEVLASRPDIHAAEAVVRGSCSAVDLAKGDRIPTPIIGPEWEIDEVGVQYVGLVYISPIPIWNSGKPLVRQRDAEHRRGSSPPSRPGSGWSPRSAPRYPSGTARPNWSRTHPA